MMASCTLSYSKRINIGNPRHHWSWCSSTHCSMAVRCSLIASSCALAPVNIVPMVEERKKISDQGKKELFEAVCFKLIEAKDYRGRLYSGIPDIAEHLDAIAGALREDGLLPGAADAPDAGGPPQEDDPVLERDEDLDLLGGGDVERDPYSELAVAVQTSGAKLGEIVKQVTDEQNALKKDQKSAKYLLKTLSSISRLLWDVRANGLNMALKANSSPSTRLHWSGLPIFCR